VRTIAHISDLHFGRHDETAAERLLADVSKAQPNVVVVTGDLTQHARHRQFAAAHAFLEKLPRPIVVVPGNHDVPLYDIVERFLGRLARYRRYISAESRSRRRNRPIHAARQRPLDAARTPSAWSG
jgi:predicted MPP superfamily phosphohydrolase